MCHQLHGSNFQNFPIFLALPQRVVHIVVDDVQPALPEDVGYSSNLPAHCQHRLLPGGAGWQLPMAIDAATSSFDSDAPKHLWLQVAMTWSTEDLFIAVQGFRWVKVRLLLVWNSRFVEFTELLYPIVCFPLLWMLAFVDCVPLLLDFTRNWFRKVLIPIY